MRFYVPCPHCGEEQYLKFGDDASPFGLKWEKNKPESVFYLCEHHGCVIHQSELDQSNGRWICENTGMWTRDGLMFFSAGVMKFRRRAPSLSISGRRTVRSPPGYRLSMTGWMH